MPHQSAQQLIFVPSTRVLADGRILEINRLVTASMVARYRAQGVADAGARVVAYTCADGMRVICTVDPTHHGELLHVSVSYHDRLPSWDDMHAVRDALYPDTVDVMMVLPRREHYVNLHPHTLHMVQTPAAWGLM